VRRTLAALSILTAVALLGVSSADAADRPNTKQPNREALLFLIAGQHNAQGYAPFSEETSRKALGKGCDSILYHQWKPEHNQEYGRFLNCCRPAMADLVRRYPEVRVVGLYWDQGESDGMGDNPARYLGNLTHLIACFRRDTRVPKLKDFDLYKP